jgi:hypothetical protein
MNAIRDDLLRYGKKDNSRVAEKAKLTVRQNVLAAIGAADAHVFDAFAGEGRMYREVWRQAASYVGCDTDLFMDERLAFVADNRRVLRAIDLGRFSIIDLDSYGSPWEQIYIIAARRALAAGDRLGLVITEGTGLKMNMGGIPKPLSLLARIKTHMPGMGAARDEVIDRAIREVCRMMQARVTHRWQAQGNRGSRVGYIGLVLEAAG